MSIKAKYDKPIAIKLGEGFNFILANKFCSANIPLKPGIMFKTTVFGFDIITVVNGKEQKVSYSTQRPIDYVCMKKKTLIIGEKDKIKAWVFNENGYLLEDCVDAFTDEFKIKYSESIEIDEEILLDEPKLENPFRIYISKNFSKSLIQKDSLLPKDYLLLHGLISKAERYGFVITIEKNNGLMEYSYPTKNCIDCLGKYNENNREIFVFEKDYYFPWLFTEDGELISRAHNIDIDKNEDVHIKKLKLKNYKLKN